MPGVRGAPPHSLRHDLHPQYLLKQSEVVFQARAWQAGSSPHILVNAAPWCVAATLHWPRGLIAEGQKSVWGTWGSVPQAGWLPVRLLKFN